MEKNFYVKECDYKHKGLKKYFIIDEKNYYKIKENAESGFIYFNGKELSTCDGRTVAIKRLLLLENNYERNNYALMRINDNYNDLRESNYVYRVSADKNNLQKTIDYVKKRFNLNISGYNKSTYYIMWNGFHYVTLDYYRGEKINDNKKVIKFSTHAYQLDVDGVKFYYDIKDQDVIKKNKFKIVNNELHVIIDKKNTMHFIEFLLKNKYNSKNVKYTMKKNGNKCCYVKGNFNFYVNQNATSSIMQEYLNPTVKTSSTSKTEETIIKTTKTVYTEKVINKKEPIIKEETIINTKSTGVDFNLVDALKKHIEWSEQNYATKNFVKEYVEKQIQALSSIYITKEKFEEYKTDVEKNYLNLNKIIEESFETIVNIPKSIKSAIHDYNKSSTMFKNSSASN